MNAEQFVIARSDDVGDGIDELARPHVKALYVAPEFADTWRTNALAGLAAFVIATTRDGAPRVLRRSIAQRGQAFVMLGGAHAPLAEFLADKTVERPDQLAVVVLLDNVLHVRFYRLGIAHVGSA